ncbi:MAG: DUF4417 domain-containing protein, partial [Planctomycetota bacterium]
ANDQSLLYDGRLTACLGCAQCPDFQHCGGLKVLRQMFDCSALCRCPVADRAQCKIVCPNNPRHFAARLREVGGWELNVGATPTVSAPRLPTLVPLIKNGSCRVRDFSAEAVAVPLAKLFTSRAAALRFSSHEELCKYFKLAPNTKIVIDSIGYDQSLEHYWGKARGAGFPKDLSRLSPALITVPNFSLFTDVPRHDNLHSMKRIAICWHELAALGLPTAIHLNARTDRDWDRWTQFLKEHPEIGILAFEFTSGSAAPGRASWHSAKLIGLARDLARPMTLVCRGGRQQLANLSGAFDQIVQISADPFVRTMKRSRLVYCPGRRARWERLWTLERQPLDDLLEENVAQMREMIECLVPQKPAASSEE